jgi:hypothetical protein
MNRLFQRAPDIADSAHELQRAAGALQECAGTDGALLALPTALAHLEEALDRLATSMLKTAQAVEESPGQAVTGRGEDALSPSARALRWHLSHLATRLRGAESACPDTRHWARRWLPEQAEEHRVPPPARRDGSPAS